jgi:hypothetical protein
MKTTVLLYDAVFSGWVIRPFQRDLEDEHVPRNMMDDLGDVHDPRNRVTLKIRTFWGTW